MRLGLRLTDHIHLLVGVAAVVLIRLNKPVWSNPPEGVYGRICYFARFDEDVLVGEAIAVISPGFGVRYVL
jgi:hypothetical protein